MMEEDTARAGRRRTLLLQPGGAGVPPGALRPPRAASCGDLRKTMRRIGGWDGGMLRIYRLPPPSRRPRLSRHICRPRMSTSKGAVVAQPGGDLSGDGFARRLRLTDGGIYDNLGLEPIWKRYRTILVSDGGA